jgi:hypothetical protein
MKKVITKLVIPSRLLILIISFLVFICPTCSVGDGESIFVFSNVSVIDAVNGLRIEQSVVVKGSRIQKIGPVELIVEPLHASIIDCTGKFMIPGLWDAHVHLSELPSLIPFMNPLLIINGITYVRDVGGDLEVLIRLRREAEEISRSTGMAPTIWIAGPIIHGAGQGIKAESVVQARFITECLINAGVDQIKLYELISPDVFFEVMDIANEKGLRVSAHVPLGLDVIEASNAGLGTIEHLFNLEMSCSSDWDSLLIARQQAIEDASKKPGGIPVNLRKILHWEQRVHAIKTQDEDRCKKVLKSLADNNTFVVPNMIVHDTQAKYSIYARDDWRKTYRYLPEPTRSEWKENSIKRYNAGPYTDDLVPYLQWANDIVPKLADAGVKMMAGTDMPLIMLTPGFSLHEELVLMVEAGLSPLQALETATLQPALFFGIEDQQGAIDKGMMADLVLLDANPLEDINNIRRIWAVMKEGHLHNREVLDNILDQLENPR